MHDAESEPDAPTGLLVLVDEAETILEQRFEVGDGPWLARWLSRWARDLLKMAAEREAGAPLFGLHADAEVDGPPSTWGPLRAQILIPDERENETEWRFATSPDDVARLADWLVEVGKWLRRPSEREAPPGIVGPDSEPEPEVFVRARASRERLREFINELRASLPPRGRTGRGRRTARTKVAGQRPRRSR